MIDSTDPALPAADGRRERSLVRTIDWMPFALALSLGWLLYLVAIPIGYMVFDSLTDGGLTLANFAEFASDRKFIAATFNSLLVAAGVALLSMAIGAPLAFGVARTTMRGKALVNATIVTSLVSPDFLIAMAYIALAGPNAGYFNRVIRDGLGIGAGPGPLDIFSMWGLIFTALPHGVAFVYLTLVPALRNVDPAFDEAARIHGATLSRAIRDITAPLMRPALLSGALLAFAGSLAMYGPPHMLRMNVLTITAREALVRLDFKVASVASVVLIAMSLVALVLYRASTRQAERFRTLGGKGFQVRDIELGRATMILTALGIGYALIALIVPYGGMMMVSLMKTVGHGVSLDNWTLANYVAVFEEPSIRKAAALSLGLASITATLVVAMGLVVAYVIVRTRLPGRALLDYLSILPLAVPGTALAIALVVVYLNWPLNALGFYGTAAILLVAYLTRFVTFGVRTTQGALIQISPELEEASRVCGAGAIETVALITVPIIRRSLIYTWILVFILALPELSSSVVLRGINTQTLSTVLLDVWNGNGGLAMACAFGMTLFAFVCALLGLAAFVTRSTPASHAHTIAIVKQ